MRIAETAVGDLMQTWSDVRHNLADSELICPVRNRPVK